MEFTKMHGLANDFIVLDCRREPFNWSRQQIQALADRHRGIGFDQLLIVEAASGPDHDFTYRIFNGDGGEVEHCGNGARCFAKYLQDNKIFDFVRPVRVRVKRGLIHIDYAGSDAAGQQLYRVDMGEPRLLPDLTLHGQRFGQVDMGNPHAVCVVPSVAEAPVSRLGPQLQADRAHFPASVNVGFMEIVSRDAVKLRVYERGAGETQACGTGACAAVACGINWGLLNGKVAVQLAGGELTIDWTNPANLTLTGPAVAVFRGSLLY